MPAVPALLKSVVGVIEPEPVPGPPVIVIGPPPYEEEEMSGEVREVKALPVALTPGETAREDTPADVASEEPVAVRTRGGGVEVEIV